jgi:hypothetical protein
MKTILVTVVMVVGLVSTAHAGGFLSKMADAMATTAEAGQVQEVQKPVEGQQIIMVGVAKADGTVAYVSIRESGEGYVGPQGEYYQVFPKVSALKSMYGR